MPRHWFGGIVFAATGKALVRPVPYEHDQDRLVKFLRDRGIVAVIDVGANKGQFARELRRRGYGGKIVSFEPLPEAHAALVDNARGDGGWTVAEACALGAAETTARMGVSENSVSSSLLPILERTIAAAPKARFVAHLDVPLRRLDDVLPRHVAADAGPLALKIDAQGYEGEVLKGAAHSLARIALIHCEASLVPLYRGAPRFADLFAMIEAAGYRCISLAPAFIDPASFEVLQVDFTFARD